MIINGVQSQFEPFFQCLLVLKTVFLALNKMLQKECLLK